MTSIDQSFPRIDSIEWNHRLCSMHQSLKVFWIKNDISTDVEKTLSNYIVSCFDWWCSVRCHKSSFSQFWYPFYLPFSIHWCFFFFIFSFYNYRLLISVWGLHYEYVLDNSTRQIAFCVSYSAYVLVGKGSSFPSSYTRL